MNDLSRISLLSGLTLLFVFLLSVMVKGQDRDNGYIRHTTYKSPNQLSAESLLEKTKPGYYKEKFVDRKTTSGSALRKLASCGSEYLCSELTLPVTLIGFEAIREDADRVKLSWETSSETNNSGFDIERSFTGHSDFVRVGRVDGAGNSSKARVYRFLDHNSHGDWSYYRLKQFDLDGTHTYSRIVAVKGYELPFTITVSPNPSTQQNIVFALDGIGGDGNVELHIYNQAGQILYQQSGPALDAQQQITGSVLPHLEVGRYYFKVLGGSKSSVAPFVILP